MSSNAPERQRRFSPRIGMPALIIAVIAIGCALGWTYNCGRMLRDAVAPRTRVGESAPHKAVSPATEPERRVGSPIPPWLSKVLPADRLREITCLEQVTSLDLEETATDETLEYVGQLPNLEDLNLSRSHITDDGLRHLLGLTGCVASISGTLRSQTKVW